MTTAAKAIVLFCCPITLPTEILLFTTAKNKSCPPSRSSFSRPWGQADKRPLELSIPAPTGSENVAELQERLRASLTELALAEFKQQLRQNTKILRVLRLAVSTPTPAICADPSHPMQYYDVLDYLQHDLAGTRSCLRTHHFHQIFERENHRMPMARREFNCRHQVGDTNQRRYPA